MSTGSLISSLFKEKSSLNRSSSLMLRNFLQKQPNQTRVLSQSRTQNSLNSSARYLPLIKMGHLITTKVKKTHYFFFCRLQAINKKHNQHQQALKLKKISLNKERFQEGLIKLSSMITLKASKQSLQTQLSKIKKYSQQRLKANILVNNLEKQALKIKQIFMKKLVANEKSQLKIEILNEGLKPLLNKNYVQFFDILKNYSKSIVVELQPESKVNSLIPISEESSCSEDEIRTPQKKAIHLPFSISKQEKSTFKKRNQKEVETSGKKTILKQFYFDDKIDDQSFMCNGFKVQEKIKIQAPRPKIQIGKAYQNMASVHQQNDQIILRVSEEKSMKKSNHLYSEYIREEVSDLYDNFSFFTEDIPPLPEQKTISLSLKSDRITSRQEFSSSQNSIDREGNGKKIQSKKSAIIELRKKASEQYQAKKNSFIDISSMKIEDMLKEIEKIRNKQKAKLPLNKEKSIIMRSKKPYFAERQSKKKSCEGRSLKKQTKPATIGKQNNEKKQIKRLELKTPVPKWEGKKKPDGYATVDVSLADTARKMKRYQTRLDNYIKSTKTRNKNKS